MYVDSQLLFCDALAITSAVGSTNTIDLSAVRDIGSGRALFLVVTVDIVMTDGSSNSTLTVALEGDSTTTITPDATANVLTIPALSAAGAIFVVALSPTLAPLQYRYIRLLFTPNTGDLTTGSFTAFLALDVQNYVSYADNITIS